MVGSVWVRGRMTRASRAYGDHDEVMADAASSVGASHLRRSAGQSAMPRKAQAATVPWQPDLSRGFLAAPRLQALMLSRQALAALAAYHVLGQAVRQAKGVASGWCCRVRHLAPDPMATSRQSICVIHLPACCLRPAPRVHALSVTYACLPTGRTSEMVDGQRLQTLARDPQARSATSPDYAGWLPAVAAVAHATRQPLLDRSCIAATAAAEVLCAACCKQLILCRHRCCSSAWPTFAPAGQPAVPGCAPQWHGHHHPAGCRVRRQHRDGRHPSLQCECLLRTLRHCQAGCRCMVPC